MLEPGKVRAIGPKLNAARPVLGTLVIAALVLLASASPAGATVSVRYRHLVLHPPAGWPVYRLARQPSRCVRFDRHALYLGRPSSQQRCPNRAIGRTAAVLVEPLGPGSPSRQGFDANGPSGGDVMGVPSRRLEIVATGPRAGLTTRRLLPGSVSLVKLSPGNERGPNPRSPGLAPASTGSTFTGLGFDTCSAPSTAAMDAWGVSPYRAVGVYIGGINSACAQPNLTAGWVATEAAAGWHLIPTYVGLQAPSTSCGCARIDPAKAAAQGDAAATDAISRAQSLGIGAGNPVYFDMEAYGRGARTSAVLGFLAAWTNRLHAGGYRSGVYSSGASGIADLAGAFGSGYPEPDDIWVGDWNGESTTNDPYLPAGAWSEHQRIHQYRGGHPESYGGVAIDIDNDALDADTAGAASGGGVLEPPPSFVNDLSLIKLRHTPGTVEVHLDSLQSGSFRRILDAASDFRSAQRKNGRWQLFGEANGAPELGFIKLRHTAGTVEVHWDTLQGGRYRRAGDFTSDFRAGERKNGRWQLFGQANDAPKLGFIKLRHSRGHVGVRWDVLRGGSYRRAGSFGSDFRAAQRKRGVWQLFGQANGAPKLGFIKLRQARGLITVHWDTLRRGGYRRAGDSRTAFGPRARRNGVWQLVDVGGGAPELAFVKLRSTRGSVEGHLELLHGSGFKAAADAGSDFSPAQARRGAWQLSPF
jgi:hypothetical protein